MLKNPLKSILFRLCVVVNIIIFLFIAGDFYTLSYAAYPSQMIVGSCYPLLKGVKIDPVDPFKLEFIFNKNSNDLPTREQAQEAIRYFLAALTIPEGDLWVNLSPSEPERIIDRSFVLTQMGESFLRQDYLLKRLAAGSTDPRLPSGKSYWQGDRTDGNNRVWIISKGAIVKESDSGAYIASSRLAVEMERDNPAFKAHILPLIAAKVNRGEEFAQLRQAYNAFILAYWFKKKIHESIFQYYIDNKRLAGIDKADKDIKEKIYNAYLKSFTNGAYDHLKETGQYSRIGVVPFSGKITKKVYFSGGIHVDGSGIKIERTVQPPDGPAVTARFAYKSMGQDNPVELSQGFIDSYRAFIGAKENSPKLVQKVITFGGKTVTALVIEEAGDGEDKRLPLGALAVSFEDQGKLIVVVKAGLSKKITKGDLLSEYSEAYVHEVFEKSAYNDIKNIVAADPSKGLDENSLKRLAHIAATARMVKLYTDKKLLPLHRHMIEKMDIKLLSSLIGEDRLTVNEFLEKYFPDFLTIALEYEARVKKVMEERLEALVSKMDEIGGPRDAGSEGTGEDDYAEIFLIIPESKPIDLAMHGQGSNAFRAFLYPQAVPAASSQTLREWDSIAAVSGVDHEEKLLDTTVSCRYIYDTPQCPIPKNMGAYHPAGKDYIVISHTLAPPSGSCVLSPKAIEALRHDALEIFIERNHADKIHLWAMKSAAVMFCEKVYGKEYLATLPEKKKILAVKPALDYLGKYGVGQVTEEKLNFVNQDGNTVCFSYKEVMDFLTAKEQHYAHLFASAYMAIDHMRDGIDGVSLAHAAAISNSSASDLFQLLEEDRTDHHAFIKSLVEKNLLSGEGAFDEYIQYEFRFLLQTLKAYKDKVGNFEIYHSSSSVLSEIRPIPAGPKDVINCDKLAALFVAPELKCIGDRDQELITFLDGRQVDRLQAAQFLHNLGINIGLDGYNSSQVLEILTTLGAVDFSPRKTAVGNGGVLVDSRDIKLKGHARMLKLSPEDAAAFKNAAGIDFSIESIRP